jgi:peptide-methionine (S)-S-oxide reductase
MPATKSVTMLAQPLTANAATPSAKPAAKPAAAPAKPARTETATFAMGCFWCGESQFEKQPGVKSVVSGYTGGPEENPTYKQVSSGYTGHYEAVQIVYDPTLTSYEKLLDMFWHGIDPTQADGQFCDLGPQYRSAVFTHDAAQRKQAEDSRKALEASKVLKKPIVTQILASSRFWPAEEYHQDFCFNSAERYNSYRQGCGRDRRLAELWGDKAAKPLAH